MPSDDFLISNEDELLVIYQIQPRIQFEFYNKDVID